MPFTRTSARRSRARANNQPPTLRRQDAEVIYETVHDQGYDVDLSTPVEQLLDLFHQNYDGQRHSVNTAANRPSRAAPATHVVNGRRIEPEPQLPAYTQHPSSNETTMDVTPSVPSESLPTYEEVNKDQGKGKGHNEAPPRS